MLALGSITVEQFFAQLYADADPEREPHSAGPADERPLRDAAGAARTATG